MATIKTNENLSIHRKLTPSETYYWILSQRQPLNIVSVLHLSLAEESERAGSGVASVEKIKLQLAAALREFPLFLCQIVGDKTRLRLSLALEAEQIETQISRCFQMMAGPAKPSANTKDYCERIASEFGEAETNTPLDFAYGPLIRITILQRPDRPHSFIVTLCSSHIVSDAKSLAEFIDLFGKKMADAHSNNQMIPRREQELNTKGLEELLPVGAWARACALVFFALLQLWELLRAAWYRPLRLPMPITNPNFNPTTNANLNPSSNFDRKKSLRVTKTLIENIPISDWNLGPTENKSKLNLHGIFHQAFVQSITTTFAAEKRQIRIVHPVDLRYAIPKRRRETHPLTSGCYVSNVIVYSKLANLTALSTMRQIKTSFALKLPLISILGLSLVLPKRQKSIPNFLELIRKAGPAQIMFSNMGRLPMRRHYGQLTIEKMHLHASLSDAGDLLFSIGQLEDQMVVTMHTIEGGVGEAKARRLMNLTLKNIDSIFEQLTLK